MRPVQIREHMRIRPFRPIRIHISDGAAYEIRHPEMAYVTATQVMIALRMAEDDLPDQVVFCDPVHITRIEPLNGSKRRKSTKK